MPVEVLVGEADGLTPVAHSRQLVRALPDAVLHVEPWCGHMLPQERPAVVAASLRRLATAATVPTATVPTAAVPTAAG